MYAMRSTLFRCFMTEIADLLGGYFFFAAQHKVLSHTVCQLMDLIHRYRPFFAGFLESTYYLVNIETFQFAIFFSYHELNRLDVFVGCEPFFTFDTFFASARCILCRIACFQCFEFFGSTVGTFHGFHSMPVFASVVFVKISERYA